MALTPGTITGKVLIQLGGREEIEVGTISIPVEVTGRRIQCDTCPADIATDDPTARLVHGEGGRHIYDVTYTSAIALDTPE